MPRTPNTSSQTRRLLAALLGRPAAWRHGYDLSKETGLKSGTLYPILMRLEGQGWLETRWEEAGASGRPPRHLYRLTGAGAAAALPLLSTAPEREDVGTVAAPRTMPREAGAQ
jgi:DNA-binding PadR family transcriptional regulator